MLARPNCVRFLRSVLKGSPHCIFATHPLHAQQLRQHAVAAYRGDVRITLVTRQHRKHYRSQNVLFRRSIGALVLQGAVPHPTLPQPVRLQKFDEVSSGPKAVTFASGSQRTKTLPPNVSTALAPFS